MSTPPRFSLKTRGMPTKFNPDRHPLDIYLLAKAGQNDYQIAQALGVHPNLITLWAKKHPCVAYALEKARTSLKDNGKHGPSGFLNYVYKNLSPELRELWDKIDRWQDHVNGPERIEALLSPHAVEIRQSLWLHAMVHTNFRKAEACRMVNVSYHTLKEWTENDSEFPKLLDQLAFLKKQFFESALIGLVEGGNTLATLFVNKTVNADMGYREKIAVTHSGKIEHNVSGNVQVSFSIDRLNLSLEARREILEAIRRVKKEQEAKAQALEVQTVQAVPPPLRPGRAKLAEVVEAG